MGSWTCRLGHIVRHHTVYQYLLLQRMRGQLAEGDRLFQLISENAADMIAVVDKNGHRLYNSPAYQKILGYSQDELFATSPLEQIHPDDRVRVHGAAEKASLTGRGEQLEYRIRHKDGSWRVLESTSSSIRGPNGKSEGLVVVNRDITERKRAEEMLANNAFHDSLTNLANRTLLLDRLARALVISHRHVDFKFGVLFIDIDGFEVFNDSLGHAAGDALLIQIQASQSAVLGVQCVLRILPVGAGCSLQATAICHQNQDELAVTDDWKVFPCCVAPTVPKSRWKRTSQLFCLLTSLRPTCLHSPSKVDVRGHSYVSLCRNQRPYRHLTSPSRADGPFHRALIIGLGLIVRQHENYSCSRFRA